MKGLLFVTLFGIAAVAVADGPGSRIRGAERAPHEGPGPESPGPGGNAGTGATSGATGASTVTSGASSAVGGAR